MLGIQQAKIGTTLQYCDKESSKTLSHVEVKLSGISSEISKEITDNLAHLIKACGPILQLGDSKDENLYSKETESINHYADVNIRDVTLFIRSSTCPEITQIRLDALQLDREVKNIKSKLSGVAGKDFQKLICLKFNIILNSPKNINGGHKEFMPDLIYLSRADMSSLQVNSNEHESN